MKDENTIFAVKLRGSRAAKDALTLALVLLFLAAGIAGVFVLKAAICKRDHPELSFADCLAPMGRTP